MAKEENVKKEEKVIEVKERAEKVSQEHLDKLVAIANKINGLQFNIGRAEAHKHKLLHELALGQDTINLMQDELMKEYGSADVNLTDGTINWPKENPGSNGVEKSKEDEK
tara:strand:+ start:1075 stop:1404 length:330 start_codon:yes stop_codon:yes gene_type:complete